MPLLQAFSLSEIINLSLFRVFVHSADAWDGWHMKKIVKDTYAVDLDGRHREHIFYGPIRGSMNCVRWHVQINCFSDIILFLVWCLACDTTHYTQFHCAPFFFFHLFFCSRLAQIYLGSWSAGRILCEIWISLDILLCTASILSLCAISLDR